MKSFFLIVGILFFVNVFGQKRSQYKFDFYYAKQMPNDTGRYILFYIVDSTTSFSFKKLTFYKFTLSRDSAECTGFISYSQRKRELLYIRDSIPSVKSKVQILFTNKNNGESRVIALKGILSNVKSFKVYHKPKEIIVVPSYFIPNDSHAIYIQCLNFSDYLTPLSITFADPFSKSGVRYIEPQICPQ